VIWIVLLGLLGGCAARRVPDRIISTDWAAVRALPAGTEVATYLGERDVRYGRVQQATDQALTLWERSGMDVMPRARIERVALRISTGKTRRSNILKMSVASAVLSGLVGLLIAGIGENGATQDAGSRVFIIGTMLGTMAGVARAPSDRFDERLVYIRP
jgi:uncharacterized membrane protein (DUF441 family)